MEEEAVEQVFEEGPEHDTKDKAAKRGRIAFHIRQCGVARVKELLVLRGR